MGQMAGRHPRRAVASGGFTLVELLVVIGIIALLVAILLPVMSKVRENANRVKCAANLKEIGAAMLTYAGENKGAYPRVTWNPNFDPQYGGKATRSPSGAFPQIRDPFIPGATTKIVNDVSASVFILVRQGKVVAANFVCPSTDATPDDFAGLPTDERSNFSNNSVDTPLYRHLSYSFANPFGGPAFDFQLKVGKLKPDFALGADLNPGCCGDPNGPSGTANDDAGNSGRPGNSNNHREDGQNVLYADYHVEFKITADSGVSNDNIYTSKHGKNPVSVSPADQDDSVLLPTDDGL
jgi:prepilin-type N-terminal cleavage/methylation domain-containing protein